VIDSKLIDKAISAPSGHHTLHVKAWGKGTACVADVDIDISTGGSGGSGGSNESIVPSSAVSVSHLEAMSGWRAQHDTGGPGSSSGSMTVVSSPSLSGRAVFCVTPGGSRYHVLIAREGVQPCVENGH
jgi:hypothetical protein